MRDLLMLVDTAQIKDDTFPRIGVEYVQTELAQMYSVIAASNPTAAGSSLPPHVLKPLALGRRLQNPEAMVAELFAHSENIPSLRMHVLQDGVRKDRLVRAVSNEVITAVNRSCVAIANVLTHEHLMPSLQFVCGLGPRKAKAMLSIFKDTEVINRQMVRVRGEG